MKIHGKMKFMQKLNSHLNFRLLTFWKPNHLNLPPNPLSFLRRASGVARRANDRLHHAGHENRLAPLACSPSGASTKNKFTFLKYNFKLKVADIFVNIKNFF
jgi:hypothetical protein